MSSAAFQLTMGGLTADQLMVLGFEGIERMSSPFDFRIELFPKDGEPLDGAGLLGQSGLLKVLLPSGDVRCLHGIVHGLDALGMRGGRRMYLARLAPAFERLKHARRSRIFQGKTTQQIVQKVLDDAKIEHRFSLSGSYSPREYCVQYRESDFDFVSRLLEWEGISYFFEHTEDSHVMVFGDAPSAHVPLAGGSTLPFRKRTGGMPNEEHVFSLERVQRLRPSKVVLRDFDFVRPALDLSSQASGQGAPKLEVYEYPGHYVDAGVGKGATKARLEERQQGEKTLDGESACPRLVPGSTFALEGHPEAELNAEYMVVEVQHRGRRPQVHGVPETLGELYRNAFRCLPKDVPFRPPQRTLHPVVIGLQTATVVGPAGEEIFTDKHGRVKVQFHWDREGQRDDASSCWIRVGQPWGGPAWGAVTLPRIGQEVVIRFLEGSPDRPLAIGAVYNGTNPTPYGLPDMKTKSTLRSNSSPGKDGFNELRFEDAAGEEEVFLHAQKDKDILVENDKSQEVRRNEQLLVKKDRTQTVEGNQALLVKLDDASLVEGNRSLDVKGNRDTLVRGSHDESVDGNQTVTISKGLTCEVAQAVAETIGAAKALNVGAGYSINVALASNTAVGGARAEEVAGVRSELVGASRQEQIGDDYTCKVDGDFQTECKKGLQTTVGKDLSHDIKKKMLVEAKEPAACLAKTFTLKADKFVLAVGGKVALSMEKSGKIKLFGNVVTMDGDDIKVQGGKVKKDPGGDSAPSQSAPQLNIAAVQPAEPSPAQEQQPPAARARAAGQRPAA